MNNSDCRCVICHDYGDRAERHPADQRLIDNVGEHGWGVLGIPEEDTTGSWAYTVGLWHTYRMPEVAMFGMNPQTMIAMLNIVGRQVAAGNGLELGQRLDSVINDGHQVVLRPIDETWRWPLFGTGFRFYRDTPEWPVLHCVWPDRAQRFPGDPEAAPEFEERQPRLDLTPAEHPRGKWTTIYEEWLEWSRT
ncbi:DUF4262 domain-containing protein [Nocardia panacis]|uniref:DUF4262 domain-containing protein n=1 Tax=Nocardia panacis TaxID=2340916 RepID=A0A3A4K1S7_9NOCA|nr:DUF4262 domain-containing protein [Nocardia panacis]RJO70087.1 DUF4262 domain-containing protein [Nocardia panacis]